jgi:hypothetical protein
VGLGQLDVDGTWVHDSGYGPVWYPNVAVVDWAPYRYGRWEWITPWGWTWIDAARWGFAPSHYGRWAMIGRRWAWVPGRLAPRPVYAPALVVFVGGSGNSSLTVGSGPGIAWYPLAPGEAWRPVFRASPSYLREVNRSIGGTRSDAGLHAHQRRPEAITALRIDDFTRGRPVERHWQRPQPQEIARAQMIAPPAKVQPRPHAREEQQARPSAPPPPWSPAANPPSAPPAVFAPQVREPRQAQAPAPRPGDGNARWPQPRPWAGAPQRGEAEDPRTQQQLERAQREQQMDYQRWQRQQMEQQQIHRGLPRPIEDDGRGRGRGHMGRIS